MHYVLRSLLVGFVMLLAAGLFVCLAHSFLGLSMSFVSLACTVAVLSFVSIASALLWGTFEKAFYKHVSRSRSFVQGDGPDDLEQFLLGLSSGNRLLEQEGNVQDENSINTFYYQSGRALYGCSADHPVPSVSFIQGMHNQFSRFFSDDAQEGGIEMKDRRSVPADCFF